MRRHGMLVILVGRFVPGGRTVTTFTAGTLDVAYQRFLAADVPACLLWALYASLLGYLGGSTFQHSVWKPLAASLAGAGAVALAIEVWRRLQRRRGKDVLGDPVQES